MSSDRRAYLLAALNGTGPANGDDPRLRPALWAELLAVTGAGLTLITDDGNRQVVRVSDDVMAHLEDLQLGLAEGPCIDAFTTRRPALEPDLAGSGRLRWLAFAPAAVEAGAAAVFAFPLEVGAARLGTLELYRDGPGMLTTEQLADALILADLLTEVVLDLQAQTTPGSVHEQLIDGHAFYAAGVHQATGMVAGQLGVSVEVALARLRARSFASGLPLPEVANLVVDGLLEFD